MGFDGLLCWMAGAIANHGHARGGKGPAMDAGFLARQLIKIDVDAR